ncbi:hypothetical protein METBIDRAFT_91392 [Metschnikowia bicuspidata var. bicuspidata NRRL YB-4993]|uniref:Uncharacterized protein n=1 Tax=Metschnikowia bicuspidata var. bicuspidata NRRL YB-4993 TaxID=869754 RepID=A0A1A0HFF0_9ASCO|nr:hypothetical protein METBIDRAFT_91392 [Metschnikowia bicuspidata var. bicuspidata NRRL YB-4993]OBA22726.1 hypothetical protein METBIDRAFT_91392 [Metschnikowia bicuspidata var. bicuspidata NRRL YB-4993]
MHRKARGLVPQPRAILAVYIHANLLAHVIHKTSLCFTHMDLELQKKTSEWPVHYIHWNEIVYNVTMAFFWSSWYLGISCKSQEWCHLSRAGLAGLTWVTEVLQRIACICFIVYVATVDA